MGNKQSHPNHPEEQDQGYDPNQYVADDGSMDDTGRSGRKRRGLFGRRRERDDEQQQVVMDPGQGMSYPEPTHTHSPRMHYLEHLSTRPSILIHLPTPPASSSLPPDPIPHPPPMQTFSLPLPVNPSYTPQRALHPPPTVRIPKPGTWMLRTVRAGGQGVKRGQLDGVREGAREMREWRKRAREAERLRRFDDACREYASLKIQTEQDIYRQSRRRPQQQESPVFLTESYPSQEDPSMQNTYSNIPPTQTVHFAPTEPEYNAYYPAHDDGYQDPPQPTRSRSIWRRSAFRPVGGGGGGGGFRQKHGMMRDEEVRDY